MNPGKFFAELKRRNVYKIAVAYCVVAWLIIQVATQVFPFFEIPDWAVQLVVLLFGTGLSSGPGSGLGFRGHSGRSQARGRFA